MMLGIGNFLWRLIPANPILLRVVSVGGKRTRDLFIRCGYLGFLVAVVAFSLLSASGSFGSMTLDQLAKVSAQLFRTVSYWQLGLVTLLAPVFTAGAITQEKDSQTYDILLSTPLSNGQIVLGSWLSRLFFVLALLVSGIPVFAITQIFGGVAISSIIYSFAIAAATALVTGAIAIAIAVFKVGTRRTIFAFYLFITVYVAGVWMLDTLPYFHPIVQDATGMPVPSSTSWFAGIHPFLALRVIFNQQEFIPPNVLDLPPNLQKWPWGWYFSSPHTFYISFMLFLSFVLVTPSIILMRRLAQSTNTFRSWILQKLRISSGDKKRKPRNVWNNPIAWREARTKASAARATVLRYGFMSAGLLGALYLLTQYMRVEDPTHFVSLPTAYNVKNDTLQLEGRREAPFKLQPALKVWVILDNGAQVERRLGNFLPGKYKVVRHDLRNASDPQLVLAEPERGVSRKMSRQFLFGMVLVEFAVILLIVTNAAASTVTREKEDGSLDLLLATPITSRYYIWGKLRGLVYFVLPLAAIPVASMGLFIVYDFYLWLNGRLVEQVVFAESVLILPGTLTIVVAFAAILGMQMSLRCRSTVFAVMSSVGIVLGICVTMGLCGYKIADSQNIAPMGLVFASFSPATLISVLLDPRTFAPEVFGYGETPDIDAAGKARLIVFIFGWIATGLYTLIVWGMYKSMVRNFDMTVRKQAR